MNMTQQQPPSPKRVAIIGAGPSGLVTAKTLLCNFPAGTFSPTVFDARDEIGGLWPVGHEPGPGSGFEPGTPTAKRDNNTRKEKSLNPLMRTNLSRFTVGFSDLAWESVLDARGGCVGADQLSIPPIPMFPQAWQVGMYLQKYVKVYIPPAVLRLGYKVVQTVREASGWTVYFRRTEEEEKEKEKKENENEERKEKRNRKTQGEDSTTAALSSEHFDFLVVASGYFSRPHIPDLPGLSDVTDRIVHSSALHDLDEPLMLPSSVAPGGSGGLSIKKKKRLLVIGGSMSGAEAASTLALRLSSSKFTTDSSPSRFSDVWKDYEVHHVCTRPLWTLPMYLPQVVSVANGDDDGGSGVRGAVSFLPLDLALYDLSRRPPGPIEYNVGPVSLQQADKTNEYLRSLLGANNAELAAGKGSTPSHEDAGEHKSRPPWIAISNDYTEFVRSGMILVTIGRVSAVRRQSFSSNLALAEVQLQLPDGQITSLDDVAAIVMATGFEPFNSLSFLPPDILSTLEYSEHDAFCPLILDGDGSCMHSDIPDLGFVGFYRGPYWGVMEMQARSIGRNWADLDDDDDDYEEAGGADYSNEKDGLEQERKQAHERVRLRALRRADPVFQRGQFPMSDYMGLMESCGRDLGISRVDISGPGSGLSGRRGPVVPARYPFDRSEASSTRSQGEGTTTTTIEESEMRTTLDSLQVTLSPEHNIAGSPALAQAIFRALHGTWLLSRTIYRNEGDNKSRNLSGTASFSPRYPTSPAYAKEYIYEESTSETPPAGSSHTSTRNLNPARYVYRLRDTAASSTEPDNDYIHIWSVDTEKESNPSRLLSHGVRFKSAFQRTQYGKLISGEYIVKARGMVHVIPGNDGKGYGGDTSGYYEYFSYTFYLQGVDISSWERAVTACSGCMNNELHDDDDIRDNAIVAKTIYQR